MLCYRVPCNMRVLGTFLLPAPLPELDDHYRPGEFLKLLKADFLDFLQHVPSGEERERYLVRRQEI